MQEPLTCDWCGKFIVMIRFENQSGSPIPYEFYKDGMGRVVKDDDDLFIIEREHKCKALCSNCGKVIILDSGKLYDRRNGVETTSEQNGSLKLSERKLHRCGS